MDAQTLLAILQMTLFWSSTIHCTTPPPPDPDQACTCNVQGVTLIPGPAGMPGEPGRDGMVGRDGRDGMRGEPGSKGENGDTGTGEPGPQGPIAIGSSGLAGDRGQTGLRGVPGKVGPSGPIGAVGPIGQKGEPGKIRRSAFSVYKTTDQVASAHHEMMTFEAADVNIGGHFDLSTNRFICQIPGVYYFAYSVHVLPTSYPDIALMKDDDSTYMASVRSENAEKVQIGSSAIAVIEKGSQAWLKFGNAGEGVECGDGAGRRCQFTGFLLYEE